MSIIYGRVLGPVIGMFLTDPRRFFTSTLTRLAAVRQTGSVSLGVDRHHGDGVAGVRQQLLQDGGGGALRHLHLQEKQPGGFYLPAP